MAATQLPAKGLTLYQSRYSAVDKSIYLGWQDVAGATYAGKCWIDTIPVFQAFNLFAGVQDVHNAGAMLYLADGKLLASYGDHGGPLYCNTSSAANDVRAWASKVTVDGTNYGTFGYVWQTGDTAGTIWRFVQYTSPSYNISYFSSTNDGATWSGVNTLWNSDVHVASVCVSPNGPNRFDFLIDNGNPQMGAHISLYHFYMTIASNGTPSFFNSTGTSLGSPPFSSATTNITRVYDGTTTSSEPFDFQVVGGVLVGTFEIWPNAAGATLTDANSAQAQYYQCVFNGTTWTNTLVAEAGTAWNSGARQDWLDSVDTDSAPGICQDPNDINVVYIAKTYNGVAGSHITDSRVEKWVNSGGWSKAADISGTTGSVNIWPHAVYGQSPTQVIWSNLATFTSFTSYTGLSLYTYPGITFRTTKTSTPVWNALKGPIGTKAYWLLAEGSGTTTKELVSGYQCPFVSTPTWTTVSPYGAALTGFSSTKYVNASGASGAIASQANSTAGYPRYLWALFTCTNTVAYQCLISFGLSTSDNNLWELGVNYVAAPCIVGMYQDVSGAGSPRTVYGSNTVTDGNPHVVLFQSISASSHVLYLDGVQVSTNAITIGAYSFDRVTIGAEGYHASIDSPFLGTVIAAGWGLGTPDPGSLAFDVSSGQFGGTVSGLTSLGASMLMGGF